MSHARAIEHAHQSAIEQQKNIEEYAQSLAQEYRVSLSNAASLHAMTSGEPTVTQRILLEQLNKKRLLIARQEQDSMSGPHQQGQGQFPPAVSPFGTRPGLSPNPADTKGRKSKLGHQRLPGSPMPDSVVQQQRVLPAPNMNLFDPRPVPPSEIHLYPQMPRNTMILPPSSHPGANFDGQQPTPQQMEAMRNAQINGQRRGVPPKPGMPQQLVQDNIALQQKEAMRQTKQMTQDQMLAHPAPARGQEYNDSRVPSIQEVVEWNHARQVEAMRNDQKIGQWHDGVPQPGMPQQMMQDQTPAHSVRVTRPAHRRSKAPSTQEIPSRNHAPSRAPRKKGTKGKKVHLRAPPSSPSSADADPRSPQKATEATPARRNDALSRPFPGTIPAGTTSNYDPDSWPCRRDMASSHVMSECFRNAPVEVPRISKTNQMEGPGSSSLPRRLGRHCRVHSHARL
jgi:hypothetical protein